MYVAVKGGETAIARSLDLLADKRRGDRDVAELSLEQIDQQLGLGRRSRDDRGLLLRPRAGGARHQAGARRSDRGDLPAARLSHDACRGSATALPIDTAAMVAERRISATFKDIPGGQVLGPTYDYTHRLLDFSLAASGERPAGADRAGRQRPQTLPRVGDILERDGLLEPPPQGETAEDLTRQPLTLPASRPLQAAEPGARRRGLPAGAGLLDPARLRQQPSLRRRDPLRQRGCRLRARGAGLRHRDRRHRRHRMRHGQPVRGLARRAAAVHARLWPGLRPRRAQGDGHGAGRPRAARRGALGKRRLRRRRTRSSCWRIPTMSRPRASCSTSSCRTMSTSSPSW